MTLGDLIFRTSRKAGLDDDVPDEHTLMLGWARDAVIEVLLRAHCTVETSTMTLNVGSYLYGIDPVVLAVINAQLSDGSELEVTQLANLRKRQKVGSSSPIRMLAIEGDRLYVYPTPTAADILVWDFVPRPQQLLTNPGDDPSTVTFGRIPTEYHRALEYYMLWQAGEYDDKKFSQTPQDLEKRFDDECKKVHQRKLGKRGLGSPRPLIGYPGRQQVPSRNDEDVVYG